MKQVGKIKEIWRFPVKSMQGDVIDSCEVSTQGVTGDRVWAMRDEARSEIQWGKKYPQLMLCKARYRSEPGAGDFAPVDITFPDGEILGSDDDRVHAKLSQLIEGRATLQHLQPPDNVAFYKRYKESEEQFVHDITEAFAREPGEPMPDLADFPEVIVDHVSVPGTFFDNEELHMITTASITHMQSLNPNANWDIRRFRPNFFIETTKDLSGLAENEWVGKRISIGEVEMEISAPTPRCGMTVRPQDDIEYDKTILRSIVKEANQCLGVGAHCKKSGRIQRGDAVCILD